MQFLFKVGDLPDAPVESPQVQFFDEVMVISTGAVVQTVKTVWKFCSCCSSKVVDTPVFTQRRSPWSKLLRIPWRFPSSLTRWPISLLCGSCRFSGAAVERTFVLPQLQLAEKIAPAENCSFRSCSSSLSFTSLLWRRGSFSWSCGPWQCPSRTWIRCSTSLFYRCCEFHRCRCGEDSRCTCLETRCLELFIAVRSCWGDFLGPCTQVHGHGGHVHRDIAPELGARR